jgi:hypothetical protein
VTRGAVARENRGAVRSLRRERERERRTQPGSGEESEGGRAFPWAPKREARRWQASREGDDGLQGEFGVAIARSAVRSFTRDNRCVFRIISVSARLKGSRSRF